MRLFTILFLSLYFCTAVSQSNWTATESVAEWIIWSICTLSLSCWWDLWYSLNSCMSLLSDVLLSQSRNSVLLCVLWFLLLICIDRQKILHLTLMSDSRMLWAQFCLFLFKWSLYSLFYKELHITWLQHTLIFWFLAAFTQISLFLIIVFICWVVSWVLIDSSDAHLSITSLLTEFWFLL